MDEGEFGYCQDTGEPISLRRLVARPTTTLSLEAQERHERRGPAGEPHPSPTASTIARRSTGSSLQAPISTQ